MLTYAHPCMCTCVTCQHLSTSTLASLAAPSCQDSVEGQPGNEIGAMQLSAAPRGPAGWLPFVGGLPHLPLAPDIPANPLAADFAI